MTLSCNLCECVLQVLPAGDQTEIGERGINLSGGQKARVALARAVYADTDIVLLDDPLAAVDAHVAQELFDSCIVGTLLAQQKCVILVTNALQFIKDSSNIVVLQDGCVVESGTYAELYEQFDEESSTGGQFYDMMKTHMEGLNTADAARGLPEDKLPPDGVDLTDIKDPALVSLVQRLRTASVSSREGGNLSDVELLDANDDDESSARASSNNNRARTISNMSEVSAGSTGTQNAHQVLVKSNDNSGKLTKEEDREVTIAPSMLCFALPYYMTSFLI